MGDLKSEIFSRNSARNLLALSQSTEELNTSTSNLDQFIENNFKNENLLSVSTNSISNNNPAPNNDSQKEEEEDTEEVLPSAHSLLQMKRFSPRNPNRIVRSQTLPLFHRHKHSLKDFYVEVQKTVVSTQSFQNSFNEFRDDLERKQRILHGDVMKVIGEIQHYRRIFSEFKHKVFSSKDKPSSQEIDPLLKLIEFKESQRREKRKVVSSAVSQKEGIVKKLKKK